MQAWLVRESLQFHTIVAQWDARHHDSLGEVAMTRGWEVVRDAGHQLLASLPVIEVTTEGNIVLELDSEGEDVV